MYKVKRYFLQKVLHFVDNGTTLSQKVNNNSNISIRKYQLHFEESYRHNMTVTVPKNLIGYKEAATWARRIYCLTCWLSGNGNLVTKWATDKDGVF